MFKLPNLVYSPAGVLVDNKNVRVIGREWSFELTTKVPKFAFQFVGRSGADNCGGKNHGWLYFMVKNLFLYFQFDRE